MAGFAGSRRGGVSVAEQMFETAPPAEAQGRHEAPASQGPARGSAPDAGARRKRALIVSANPWPLWIGVERHLASELSRTHLVDGLNVGTFIAAQSPVWDRRAQLYERLVRKYVRFVVPALNGRDITPDIRLPKRPIPPLPESVTELRQYRLGDSAVGLAALSSAASFARVASTGATSDYGLTLRKAWEIAHRADELARAIAERAYDEIYIFNGRHCISRPFCDLLSGTARVRRFEAGGKPHSFVLFDGVLHHAPVFADVVRRQEVDEAAGHAFYRERKERVPGNDAHRLTKDQQRGKIPPDAAGAPLVTYFSSSPDEFFATADEYTFGEFESQGDIAAAVAAACAETGKKLVVRLHPHLESKHSSWRDEWDFDQLRELGAVLVWPSEPYDSYALMEASDCVVTCGSTIGIEAAYWGMASMAIGDHFNNQLGITVAGQNAGDIGRFVEAPYCLAGSRPAAIAYGSFAKRSGTPVCGYSEEDGFESARIDGRIVDPIRYWTARLKRLFRPASRR